MAPNPIVIPRNVLRDPVQQAKVDPLFRICYIPTSIAFASFVVILVAKYAWAQAWLLSGTPVLTYIILVGASRGYRILPFLHLWMLLATVNLLYSIACTSWLLNGFFTASCWPAIFITSLFQFNFVAKFARARLRALLSQLHFVNDKIAFFNIPALEIDVNIAGLLVIRGLTISLSSLTVEAHGIELGMKLTDDMELAIQVELVRVLFFRRIECSDIFANLKGGVYEMTFGKLEENTFDADGNALMNENTPLLRAASINIDDPYPEHEKVKMTEYMTDGKSPEDSSAKSGLGSITTLAPDHDDASLRFHETMEHIISTNAINRIRKELQKNDDEQYTKNRKTLRAAICSLLHDTPSVPHPPQRSIKVTTLQNSSPPWVKRFQHRLPLLLRLLLGPLSYFHPISFSSITGTASGQWIRHMVLDHVFKGYSENNQDIRNLEGRISAWLADANFALEMDEIIGQAQVPILTDYDINCFLGVKDILIYRTLPKKVLLKEAIRLGGADATFTIPTFLLPHHEHIIPPKPSFEDKQDIKGSIENADGKPQQFLAEKELDHAEKDETNVQMSVHARLPACLDQELLNFIAAIVKATKLVEMEKEPEITDLSPVETDTESIISIASDSSEPSSAKIDTKSFHGFAKSLNTKTKDGFKNFNTATRGGLKNLNTATKEGLKKAVVGGIVNDRWIAKLVGKVTKVLETAQGDIGYSGSIPVSLESYRQAGIGEASKLLP
jgi:hypothetical protein